MCVHVREGGKQPSRPFELCADPDYESQLQRKLWAALPVGAQGRCSLGYKTPSLETPLHSGACWLCLGGGCQQAIPQRAAVWAQGPHNTGLLLALWVEIRVCSQHSVGKERKFSLPKLTLESFQIKKRSTVQTQQWGDRSAVCFQMGELRRQGRH